MKILLFFTLICFILSVVCVGLCVSMADYSRIEHQQAINIIREYESRFNYMIEQFNGYEEYTEIKRYFDKGERKDGCEN